MRLAALALTGMLAGCGFQVAAGTGTPGDDQPRPDASDGGGGGEGGPDWLTGFTDRIPIDLAAQSIAMPDFVASIAEDTDPRLAGAQTIAFTSADGVTPLSTELVAFDAASGRIEAWVATELAAGAPTRIYLYHGTGPLPLTPLPWTALYAGVWHMAGGFDSKGGHDASVQGGSSTPAREMVGVVGAASRYDGVDDTMVVGDPSDGSLDFATTSFTIALWVKVDASHGSFDMPLFKGGSSIGSVGWDYELGTGAWNAGFADATSIQVATFGQEATLLHQWHYLVSQCDRAAGVVRTYTDGVLVQALPAPSGSLASTRDLKFGDTSYLFKGVLDEVRVYTQALSPERIAAEYSNIATRPAFVMFGNPEHLP